MTSALVIGGTGFVGRHAVADLLDHGYEVASLDRGRHGYEFPDDMAVERIVGDRTEEATLVDAARRVDPDVVLDCAAFHPDDVRAATETFADAEYVYVSSGSVYAVQEIPKREDGTPLRDCTPEQAADDTMATYPNRKAAADRAALDAADRGVAATSVRPTVVYGPKTLDPREGTPDPASPSWAGDRAVATRHDYWIDRIRRHDRVVVPGDGTAIWHRAYVEDVASALRVAVEEGAPGEAYNAGDRRVCTLGDVVDLLADALGTSVEVVHASRRDLARVGLDPGDFPFYHHPMTGYPHVLDTCKLASLGWEPTPVEAAAERTVAESLASGRDGGAHDPGRNAEERLLDALAG